MAPPNPWERSVNPQRSANEENVLGGNLIAGTGGVSNAGNNFTGGSSAVPPPLPPRPTNSSSVGVGYSNYGSNWGPVSNPYYGNTSFPSYTGYSGYNRPLYGNSFYGAPETGDFVRLAEEQSRNAFQSIESVVQAFSSISMMLESTLNAFHSSFRAVLGVADQFSRLKLQMSQIVTTLAVVRFLRWVWRRLLILLRLRPLSGTADDLWQQAVAGDSVPTAAQILAEHGAGKGGGSWATLVFFTCVLGGPYLIWKLVSKLASTVEDRKRWATGEKPHFIAVALYDFQPSAAGELSVRPGQRIRLAPKELQPTVRGWILGSTDGSNVGLVPANYIKIIGKQTPGDGSKSQAIVTDTIQRKSAEAATSDWERQFEEPVKGSQ